MTTRVKVCGLTTARDAAMVTAAGASAIGVIFWPGSRRVVTPAQARRIVDVLPPLVLSVGVFVDASPAYVAEVVETVGLDLVQLHGDERVDDWADCPRPVIKALTLVTYASSPWVARARAVLLDAHDPVRRGGTGECIDWCGARDVAGGRPFLLAGGLTAANVGAAILTARPAGLDVASGVERAPGDKDPSRVQAFFDAVRRADDAARQGAAADT